MQRSLSRASRMAADAFALPRLCADNKAKAPSSAAKQAMQLMATAAAAALTTATAQKTPEQVNCVEHIQEPLLAVLRREKQQPSRQTSTIGDFPLSLVSRVLFPLNPHLQGGTPNLQEASLHDEAARARPNPRGPAYSSWAP
ncbi:phosphatidylinositol n-acetylglucosaminyltransferase [Cyclospora cayetanensis]|uniref:Phosphatidylinositol n-acetylglucosaminyltransferase n=1 Tax=Cyclospora cayetanensis TaxID=88456 RepID=A0A1D3CQS4_9EIME|nr:phosphatidylinositol n-acetylglucosaminyltransferase [Cyclospora cayetanensis]